ncbi:hypothetical protein [Cohnella hashimotonis]|uniref:DUF975 domain-containing protein n=1 Tax=Cohnella hashimotonis TaxID=2826895 RepID=A0ABT6TM68_9BACL|nr:hypothetical protein [Cohnella hashimotonis]MDI4647946.1 hypothetical protein [Cohnella hashimotonis]
MYSFMNIFKWYQDINLKLIQKVENYKEKLPFCSVILLYLKTPLALKLVIGFIFSILSIKLYYMLGFIVLQSKARNEALSIVSAFQNPIPFEDDLVFKYAFIFCFLVISSMVPLLTPIILHYLFIKKVKTTSDISILKKCLRSLLLAIIYLLSFSASLYVVLNIVPFIVYVMLFKSRYDSILEFAIRKIAGEQVSIQNITLLDPEYLNSRIKYSLNFELWIFSVLIFFVWLINALSKKSRKQWSKFVYTFLSRIMMIAIIIVLISHVLYIPGYLGKSISNFDMDYVAVDYELEGINHIEGIRIFEKEHQIIIRDDCNITHSITSDNLHIKTIKTLKECKDNKD